jgi:hypothetical protein
VSNDVNGVHSYASYGPRSVGLREVSSGGMVARKVASLVVATDDVPLASATYLSNPKPNPLRLQASFAYDLAADCLVDLSLIAPNGRRAATVEHGWRTAGHHQLGWPIAGAPALGSGVYVLRLQAGGDTRSRRVLLLGP